MAAKKIKKIDYHILKQSMSGAEDECGDTGLVEDIDEGCFIALVDVLGHGKEAHDVALLAETYLLNHYTENLKPLMEGLHNALSVTRGAVVAVCRLNLQTGELSWSSIGNISINRFGSSIDRLLPKDGIVGYRTVSPAVNKIKLYSGDILILRSDGIREHFNIDDYPGILLGNAKTIAARLLDQLGKPNDDASCIVLRYGI